MTINLNMSKSYLVLQVFLLLQITGTSFSVEAQTKIPPVITLQPQSQSVALDAQLKLSVKVTSALTISYLWYKNGKAISPTVTSSSLTIKKFRSTDVGSYYVQIRNSAGTVKSAEAYVRIASQTAPNEPTTPQQPNPPTQPTEPPVVTSPAPISADPFLNARRTSALNTQIASSELLDYLISDVCISASGDIISGDPYNCGRKRNIRIGENIPYIVTDFDRKAGNITYSAMASLPFLGMDGALKVVHFKSLEMQFTSNYNFTFNFRRDGYDLTDVSNSNYVSFIRTTDPGCYDQLWSGSGSGSSVAARAGGWILFPSSSGAGLFTSGQTLNMTYNIPLSPERPSNCQAGNSYGATYWNSPAVYTFETGKNLTAIKSFHFAAANLGQTNNALELYYFSKEYGFTRWEAWIPQSRCWNEKGVGNPQCDPRSEANYLQGRCSVMNVSASGHPGIDYWGGQTWVRVDCRDQTNYIALQQPQIFIDRMMGQSNGIVDIDTSGLQSLPVAISKNIPAGTVLKAGESLVAGNVKLTMQTDGNLVVYGPNGGALWATSAFQDLNASPFSGPTYGLACTKCYVYFQSDGNVVLYNPDYMANIYHAYWSSETYGPNRKFELSTSSPYIRISTE